MASSLIHDKHGLVLAGRKFEDFLEMNKQRIYYSEISLSVIGVTCHITGSRSEGVHQVDSDTDILIFDNDIEAVENVESSNAGDSLQIQIENTTANPGYAMLRVHENHLRKDIALLQYINQPVEYLCNNVDGKYYLSIHKTINAMSIYAGLKLPWSGGRLTYEERSGPAKHVTVETGNKKSDLDILYTIQNRDGSKHMEQWQLRSRSWPTEDVVREIMQFPEFLVPLGHPSSQEDVKDSQWKFSFNLQERTLMRNLKGAQIISYNLLKSLKHYIKELKDTETEMGASLVKSYYFKTCFLWTLEQIPASDWSEEKIVQNTILCLHCLLDCLKKKQCPHYFIPENNLFEGKDIISMDLSNLEMFLTSICDTSHPLWTELLTKILAIINKPYTQKQPLQNSVSICRHLLVLSVKEKCPEEALQIMNQRYETINSLNKDKYLIDKDWESSILLTLQSTIATLQCYLQMEVEKNKENEEICEQSRNLNAKRKITPQNQQKEQSWRELLEKANEIDVCSGRLKEATVQFWLRDYGKANKVTKSVIDREAVNIMHHTGFNHVKDDNFKEEENSMMDWSSLMKSHIYFDVLFIPAEIQICPPAIQLQLCEGRGLMVNPLVYAYYLQFCIMQQTGATSTEISKHLDKWQRLLDDKKKMGFYHLDFELVSFCYLAMGNFDESYENLLKGFRIRDIGTAHYWMLGMLLFQRIAM